MKPTFTTPCFIRKNAPELRRKLEKLGYEPARYSVSDNENLCIATAVSNLYAHYNTIIADRFDSTNPHITWNCAGRIDCGTNEDLFLAIAALREDSDKNQWFCDDIEESKSFFFCEYDDVEKHIHEKMDGWDCEGFHKATVEELIEHFKKD